MKGLNSYSEINSLAQILNNIPKQSKQLLTGRKDSNCDSKIISWNEIIKSKPEHFSPNYNDEESLLRLLNVGRTMNHSNESENLLIKLCNQYNTNPSNAKNHKEFQYKNQATTQNYSLKNSRLADFQNLIEISPKDDKILFEKYTRNIKGIKMKSRVEAGSINQKLQSSINRACLIEDKNVKKMQKVIFD